MKTEFNSVLSGIFFVPFVVEQHRGWNRNQP